MILGVMCVVKIIHQNLFLIIYVYLKKLNIIIHLKLLILWFHGKFSKALKPPPQKKNVGNNKRWYFGSWVLQQICTTWQVHISFFFKNHSTLLLTSIIFRSTCHQHDMIKIEELHFLPTQKQLLFILSFVSNLQYTYDVMYIFCFVHKVENRI